MKSLVSICIAVYNAENTIAEAIESALIQDYKPLEIIIIDDGSTDNTLKITHKYEVLDARVRVYNQSNHGIAPTRINLVKKSKGWALAWLDADDFLTTPCAVSKLVQVMIDNPKIGFVYSNFYDQKHGLARIKNSQIILPNQTNLQRYKSHHFRIFTRQAYNKTLGWDFKMSHAEDYDLALKLEEITQTKFIDEIMYYYRFSHQKYAYYIEQDIKFQEKAKLAAKKRRGII